jgi:hypothetical protein
MADYMGVTTLKCPTCGERKEAGPDWHTGFCSSRCSVIWVRHIEEVAFEGGWDGLGFCMDFLNRRVE